MKKILIFFCAVLLYNQFSSAQFIGNHGRPEVMPASPTAIEFLKHGEVPIGKYTGVHNLSIPIYVIQVRGLSLPISLSYHSSGIKVSDEAGWTGLGWSLIDGGSIVQVVNGYDDFGYYKNRTFPDIDEVADVASNGSAPSNILSTCTGTIIQINDNLFSLPNNSNVCGVSNPRSTVIPADLMGGYSITPKDYEPDVFKFNALGYSGTFVLNWQTGNFICLTDSKIRVNKIQNNDEKIEIILPEGHRLEFSVKEKTTIIDGSNEIISVNEATSRVYKLDHIYTNYNDHISFDYLITDPVKNYDYKGYRKTFYETTSGNAFPFGLNSYSSNSTFKTEQSFSYLTKITFNKGVVLFNTSSRQDLVGAKKLDNIVIKESENSSQNIKRFNFNYSYFIGHINSNAYSNSSSRTLEERTYRLKLDSVSEDGKKPYTFQYNSTKLPEKLAYARDYWGYYNGVHNNTDLFPNIYRFNYQNLQAVSYFTNQNNRSSRLQYAKAAILEKITYPTGGYTTFEYELNAFNNFIVPNFNDGVGTVYSAGRTSYGAGLRVNKVQNYNYDNSIVNCKQFYYRGGKLMTPLRFFNKSYISNYYHTIHNPLDPANPIHQNSIGFRWTLSTSSFIPPSINALGNYVGYDEVEESFLANDNAFKSIGSTINYFENHFDEGIVLIGQGVGMITNNHWRSNGNFSELNLPTREANLPRNGSVLEMHVKDKNGNMKQKVVNKYDYGVRTYCTNGTKIGPVIKKVGCSTTVTGISWSNHYLFGVYPIRGLDSHIKSSEKTDYFSTENIVTKEDFFYNDLNQMTEKRVITSTRDTIYEYADYPIDVNNYNLLSNNFFSPILKKRILRNGVTLQEENYIYNQLSIANANHVTYALRQVEDKVSGITTTYNYDNTGNIQEITQKDNPLKVYYIWGYNKKYPIVKIEGSGVIIPSSTLISAAVSASNGNDDQILLEKLQDIRDSLPRAMVTTFTYAPLVGVTSITDPRGNVLYYEYDTFNRLKLVKDKDGNIIKENTYHYKN